MATTKKKISAEDFVKVWQASSTTTEVAEKLKLAYATVITRSNQLRKIGVKIKAMPRKPHTSPIDVGALNKLCGTGASKAA